MPASSREDRKYENLTFRLEPPTMQALRQGVKEDGVSLNNLANRQLQQYAEWDRLADKMGYTSLRQRLLRVLLAKIPEAEVAELGTEQGALEAREYIAFNWRGINLENFLRFVDNYARYAHAYEVEHFRDTEHTLILFHRLTEKWSVFLEAFMLSALDNLLGIKARSSRTDQSVSLTFREPEASRRSQRAAESPRLDITGNPPAFGPEPVHR